MKFPAIDWQIINSPAIYVCAALSLTLIYYIACPHLYYLRGSSEFKTEIEKSGSAEHQIDARGSGRKTFRHDHQFIRPGS